MTEHSQEIKVNPKEILEESFSYLDKKEVAKFRLEQKAAERDERLRKKMLLATMIFFWFLSVILAIAVFIFAWHKFTPYFWAFLSEKKIDSIQIFLLGGALAVFLSSFVKNLALRYTNIKKNNFVKKQYKENDQTSQKN